MAVKVLHPVITASGGTQTTHSDGSSVTVEDGHLKVRKNTGGANQKTIAIYAPNAWTAATVESGS